MPFLQAEATYRAKQEALAARHAQFCEAMANEAARHAQECDSKHVQEQVRLEAVAREEAAKRRLAEDEVRTKLSEKNLLDARLRDTLEAQQRQLQDAQGEIAALRMDRETLQSEAERAKNEELRRAKQKIVDAVTREHAEKLQTLQGEMRQKELELAQTRSEYESLQEDFDDTVNPMTEQNSLLQAKVDALSIAARLPSRTSRVVAEKLELFANAIREAQLKREKIVEVVRGFLKGLHRADVLEVGYMVTLRLTGKEPASEVIDMILKSKFEK